MSATNDRAFRREELPVTPEIREQLRQRRGDGRRALGRATLGATAILVGGGGAAWLRDPDSGWLIPFLAGLLALLLLLIAALAVALEVAAGRRVRAATFRRSIGLAAIGEHLGRWGGARTHTLDLSGGPGTERLSLRIDHDLADLLRPHSGSWLTVDHTADGGEILAIRDEQGRRIP